MHVLVLGAAGMVGRKLVERLLRDGRLGKSDISRLTLQDVVAPNKPEKAGIPSMSWLAISRCRALRKR